jgi:hypothetical protein
MWWRWWRQRRAERQQWIEQSIRTEQSECGQQQLGQLRLGSRQLVLSGSLPIYSYSKAYIMKANPVATALLATLLSATGAASQVTDLTTFTSGTPARASEVNANFDALKTAVNDTDARVTAVENSKQNRITGSCPAGMAVAAIDADGSVTCEQWRPNEGIFSVALSAFVPYDGGGPSCQYVANLLSSAGYFRGNSISNCHAVAQVQLPEGAEITRGVCRLIDSSAVGYMRMQVFRQSNAFAPDQYYVYNVIATSESTTGVSMASPIEVVTAEIEDGADAYTVVDNENYQYFVRVTFQSDLVTSFDTIQSTLSLSGCGVYYRY